MASTPGKYFDGTGFLQSPKCRHVLPHEIVFILFLGVVWVRVVRSTGFGHSNAILFLLYPLSLICVVGWCQSRPTSYRWFVRLLFTLAICTLCYFSLSTAVPLIHNPSGLATLDWLQDATLDHWDTLWFGDAPHRLMLMETPSWVTDIFMVCYLFFFYYIIGGLVYYCLKDLNKFRLAVVGFSTIYALGYVGYMLVPALGPAEELGPRTGGLLADMGGGFINQSCNGVDAFPSIHMAASLYLLIFDFEHRRAHFWWVLVPTVGLWISTVYLRYHYGVDLIAGVILALGCVWLTRWFARSRLCAEVEAECRIQDHRTEESHETF